jgi:hypothetical protein
MGIKLTGFNENLRYGSEYQEDQAENEREV